MTYWAQLFHFYQPPTQTHEILARIAEESYRPLLAVLREHPHARIAVNIQGVLTDLLYEHGMGDVLDSLQELVERGQVELVGSGKYHPILPLVPEHERERSIAEHARTNRGRIAASNVRGFFPPELCYSPDILPAIAAGGHDWLLLSGVACPTDWPTGEVCRVPVEDRTLGVLFRDDVRSNRISFRETSAAAFVEELAQMDDDDLYVLTAMDAETYGHHIRGWEREFLAAAYERIPESTHDAAVCMVQPSELLTLFPAGPVIEPLPSSWSTTRDDIAARNPYPLWQSPGNPVHDAQWEVVSQALDVLAIAHRYSDTDEAKRYALLADNAIQPALHSCQFWWASRRPMWEPVMVERGLNLLSTALLYATRAVLDSGAAEPVKREVRWRLAAANEARGRIERHLFVEQPA